MAGVSIRLDVSGLDEVIGRLGPVLDFRPEALTEEIGVVGEGQTTRRILEEKTAPDGTPWAPNRAGNPTLVRSGYFVNDTIGSSATADAAEWGSTFEFAHVHQEGAVIEPKTAKALRFVGPNGAVFARRVVIPARPFIGISDDNWAEIEDRVTDFFRRRTGGRS